MGYIRLRIRELAEQRGWTFKEVADRSGVNYNTVRSYVQRDTLNSDTHYRVGDWEVVRVEQYPTAEPGSNYDLIAVCYCQYAPKPSPLMPVPSARISIDSFGGDEAAYQQYLESIADIESVSLSHNQKFQTILKTSRQQQKSGNTSSSAEVRKKLDLI
jgi:hypothetical protein